MSLQFIMGPSGAGKSHYLYETVTRESIKYPEKKYIVLVPEQFTMQTQKDLVMASPRKGILNVDVLSFNRLAYRVFEETGAGKQTILDDIGKNFVLRKIAGDCEEELQVLGGNLKKVGYISEMKSVISEFSQYDVQLAQLDQMIDACEENTNLYYKLQDIRKVYEGFQKYLQDKYITSEGMLEILCGAAGKSKLLQGSTLVLDGFTGFTPVQNKLLRELMKCCEQIMVTVTIDKNENPYVYKHPYQLFALSKQMVTGLMDIARKEHVEILEPITLFEEPVFRFREKEALGFLEKQLFRYRAAHYEKEQEELQIWSARSPQEEIDFVAQKIRFLIRTKNYQYRDIAVIASDMNVYGNQIEKVFEQYEIPVFMDHKRSILLNSFVEYLRSFLAMTEQGFSYESVFRYLRTGLTCLTSEQIDVLENYVVALGIRGRKKWEEKWIRRTRGMNEEELAEINTYREQFVHSIAAAVEVLRKRKKTVREITIALHELFLKEKLQEKVKAYEVRFAEAGELALEKEYAQVYRIVIELFDKFVDLLGEEQVSLKEYCELLDAGLEQAAVGIIPPSMDQIMVGDIERTRIKDIKMIFVVGVNDSYLPGNSQNGGLLSDYDRELFENKGIALAPGAKEKTFIQKFYLYVILTKSSEGVCLTFSKTSADGKTLRPAYLVSDLLKMYPLLKVREKKDEIAQKELTPRNGIQCLIDGLRKRSEGMNSEWQELYSWYKKNPEWSSRIEKIVEAAFYHREEQKLKLSTAKKLYGEVLENSVTRLEKFSACAYAHFLTYGLGLQQREEYQFQALDLGNLFHSAIERYALKLRRSSYGWTDVPEELREQLIQESVEESIIDYGNTILYSSARNEYIILRLKRMLRRSVWALTKQLEKGSFVPSGFEVKFGTDSRVSNIELEQLGYMRLRGKIDRIDICEEDDNVYVKIIDYKTGAKKFNLVELYHGLQLQLLVYMNVAMEIERKNNPEKRVVPAGIFYYQMQDPLISAEEDLLGIDEKILGNLKPDGIIYEDMKVIELLDKEFETESLVIPVKKTQKGNLTAASSTLSPTDMKVLSQYTEHKVREIGKEILEGEISAKPYELGGATGCTYCPYHSVCGFDTRVKGNEYRNLETMSKADVLAKMNKEVQTWE